MEDAGLQWGDGRTTVSIMTAAQIIGEIARLPVKERAEVESFIRRDESAARLSPSELGRLAGQLAESDDSASASAIEERMVAGFYGKA